MERNTRSPLESMRAILEVVPARRKCDIVKIFLLMSLGAALEVITIGSILPFLSLLSGVQPVAHLTVAAPMATPMTAGACFAAFVLVSGAMRVAIQKQTYRFTFRIGADLAAALMDSTLNRPYAWHTTQNSSEIISSLQKINSVINNLVNPFMQALVACIMALSIMTVVILVSHMVALFIIFTSGCLYFAATFRSRQMIREHGVAISRAESARLQVVQESLGGIRYVILDKLMRFYSDRFREIDEDMRARQAAVSTLATSPRIAVESLGLILLVALSFWMSRQHGGLVAALPQLGAMAIGAQRLLPHMQSIYYCWSSLNSGQAQLDDVLDLIAPTPTVPQDKPAREVQVYADRNIQGGGAVLADISLDAVTFGYHPDRPVLRNATLCIPAGSLVGIKGQTGSGKSTLIDILSGLLPPDSGRIYARLKDGEACSINAFQGRIAYVPQAVFLADATVAENIAFGQPSNQINHERLVEMCRKAQIIDEILAMPEGFETMVGEGGVRLSGGQRQRIGIARALYKSSDVLILDEATSALDHVTERKVIEAITEEGLGRTVIMVAHRLSTLDACDRIFALKDGSLERQYGKSDDGDARRAAV